MLTVCSKLAAKRWPECGIVGQKVCSSNDSNNNNNNDDDDDNNNNNNDNNERISRVPFHVKHTQLR